MDVPFLDLKTINKNFKKEFKKEFNQLLEEGNFILGDKVKLFEKNFASFCSTQYAVGVGSGLDALVLILKSLDIKENDEVLVPSHTFIATWLAVSHVGAKPVPVAVSESNYNIDPNKLQSKINKKTKAIIMVHLYGNPCEVSLITNIAKKNNLHLIEDAAQAHGALYKGRRVGSFGIAAAFSFYPGKNIGALGDGGIITTNSLKLYRKILSLRNYGSIKKYEHKVIGFNSRLDEIQAAFLNIKLKNLDSSNNRRIEIANLYLTRIRNEKIILPEITENAQSVWHLFIVRTKKRNELSEYLNNNGIKTLIHYPSLCHKQACYYQDYKNLSINKGLAQQIISIPISPVMNSRQVNYVIDKINNF